MTSREHMILNLQRAFGNAKESEWTESQRRIIYFYDAQEDLYKKLERELADYKDAAAKAWLRDNS